MGVTLKDEAFVEMVKGIFEEIRTSAQGIFEIKRMQMTICEATQPSHQHPQRAMQISKNHLISGFCCTDSEWPLQLWHQLTHCAYESNALS